MCTLVLATIVLPILTDKPEDNVKEKKVKLLTARRKLIKAALTAIKENMNETNKTASFAVIAEYNEKMKNLRFQQFTVKNRTKKMSGKSAPKGYRLNRKNCCG